MSWRDSAERWHNRASDTRYVWFPFENLRPKKAETISLLLGARMAVAFGVYYGAFISLRRFLLGQPISFVASATTTASLIAAFSAWFTLVTAPLWNRRARRLAQSERSIDRSSLDLG